MVDYFQKKQVYGAKFGRWLDVLAETENLICAKDLDGVRLYINRKGAHLRTVEVESNAA